MARNIYESKHKEIRELKQARVKEPMIELVVKMAKQVNQRFYRLEKAEKGLSDSAYKYAQKETNKQKPRYSVNKNKLEKLDINELYKLAIKLNQKIISKTSTIPGLREIRNKRLEMSLGSLHREIHEGPITQDEKEDFDTFLMNGGGELMNNKFLDSNQIREDWFNYTYKGGVSEKEFIKLYNKFKKDDTVDYAKIRRKLINLNSKKRRKKKG